MLRKLQPEEFDKYIDFAYALALDQTKSSYPTYTDGIKTKDDFVKTAAASFTKDGEEILLFEYEGTVEGWIHYYVLEEDNYISFKAFNINKSAQQAIRAFLKYLDDTHKGYSIDFGFPSVNVEAISALKENGFTCIEESNVNVLHFRKYSPREEASGIVQVTRENYSEFGKLHAQHDAQMYWNTERLYEDLDNWRIFLYYENDELLGAIYFVYIDTMMEIFGVDFPDDAFDKNTFGALLIKALNEGKESGLSSLTFFTGDDEQPIVRELDFDYIGRYILHRKEIGHR